MIVMRAMPESPESEPIPDFDFYRDSVVGINLAAGISLLAWLVITEAGRYSFNRRSEIPVANIMKIYVTLEYNLYPFIIRALGR